MTIITDVASLEEALHELSASIEASVAVFMESIDLAADVELYQAGAGMDDESGLPIVWAGHCVAGITIDTVTTRVDTLEN